MISPQSKNEPSEPFIRRFLEFLREMGREKQLTKINFVVLMSTDAARIVPRNENRQWTVESILSATENEALL